MIKVLGGIIAGFAVFIILIFVVSACTKKTYTYEKLEEKMVEIAKSHYQANEKELPSEDKDSKTLTLKKMITSGYLEEVVELFDNENVKCDGNVTVTNNNGYYLYTPYLSCSGLDDKDYTSVFLNDKIVEDNLVESGVGLYEYGDRYVFRGETNNNFVKFGEKLFRIIAINDDGTIRLFEWHGLRNITWDDRYNIDKDYESGFNEYYHNSIDSRIKEELDKYYDNTAVWTDDMKSFMTTQNVCAGKRSETETARDGVAECSILVENQVFALMRTDEFMLASLDENCKSTLDYSCKNYNWFKQFDRAVWTSIGVEGQSHKVYKLTGELNASTANSPSGANVVINITDKAVYAGGTGTEEDPYTFR